MVKTDRFWHPMMWVSKIPNYDAYGLFRALHSHNPIHYSHIVGLSSHFYVYAPLRSEQNEHPLDVLLHIGAGPRSKSTYEQAHVDLDL